MKFLSLRALSRSALLWLTVACSHAGTITSGSLVGWNNDNTVQSTTATLTGVSQNGTPFSFSAGGIGPFALQVFLGNSLCPGAGPSAPMDCTWGGSAGGTFNLGTTPGNFNWDGEVYNLGSGGFGSLQISIQRPVQTDASTVSCSSPICSHVWAFGGVATVQFVLQLSQSGKPTVFETLSSNAIYQGGASSVGFEQFSSIQYSLVPEPGTWGLAGLSLLGCFAVRRAQAGRRPGRS